jgi:N-acyl amino acid synthase of PEP-CTERM/exosortase system
MFDNRFETFLADTSLSKTIHYNLRCQIYCLDKCFEISANFADEQESDNYDSEAIHFIVRSREPRQWVGAMRLILAPPSQLLLSRLVTFESDAIQDLKDQIVAEASRLCVLPAKRVGPGKNISWREACKTLHPSSITLGLIRAAKEYCLSHGIRFSLSRTSLRES